MCVYSSFKKSIGHYGSECCHYSNTDCNRYAKKSSEVSFSVS